MRTMKKMLAGAVALTMALTMNVAVFAQGTPETTYTDESSVTISKKYVATNGGTSPAETFNFDVTSSQVADGEATSVPALTVGDATFSEGGATQEGGTASIQITLPKYERVGVYEYTLEEVAGDTAGVEYDETDVVIKVTVIKQNGALVRVVSVHENTASGAKIDAEGSQLSAFTNTYKAGTLAISKDVTGNLGDTEKYFEFKVTLNAPSTGETVSSEIGVGKTSYESNPTSITVGTETTFYLKSGETLNLTNIPYGVTYTVTETADSEYTTTVNGTASNSVTNQEVDTATETVAFVNNKTGEIDTGISTDSLPYFLIAAGVAAGAAVLVTRRRRFDD